jgi:DNA replication protein DnaC
MPPATVDGNGGITLWGAPSTGKTTFVAALHVGLIQRHSPWHVRGVSKADSDSFSTACSPMPQ